jgi:uncharacterized protein
MELAVSGVTVSPWLPPLVAFVISFVTSMGGVSGAFLLLPFQMSVLGFTGPAVSATNQLFNVIAIPSGVLRYLREGRMVWPLTGAVIVGTLPGVLVGAVVRVRYLPDPRPFKLFVGLVLAYVGVRMAADLLVGVRAGASRRAAETRFQELVSSYHRRRRAAVADLPRVAVRRIGWRRVEYEFYGERFSFPTAAVLLLSLAVGVVGGIYGIGGGAIIAPFLVSVLRLPVYTVAGAALMGTFVTSVAGVGFYQALAPFYPHLAVAPDWRLGALFGVGGMAGIYLGARAQKHVPARVIKAMLALVVVGTAAKYVVGFFTQ